MKKILGGIIVAMISVDIFALTSYFNSFQRAYPAILSAIIIYFLCGLIFRAYYNMKNYLVIFASVTLILFCTIFFLRDTFSFLMLSTFFYIITCFTFGYFCIKLKKILSAIIAIAILSSFYFISFNIYPKIAFANITKQSAPHRLVGSPINNALTNVRLQDIITNEMFQSFSKDSVYLIDFYFKRCLPCKQKKLALIKIAKAYESAKLRILFVDNGNIDEKDKTKFNISANSNIIYYYDSLGVLCRNLDIHSYPFEIIVDKKGVVRYILNGYGFDIDQEYINSTSKKLNFLLNE